MQRVAMAWLVLDLTNSPFVLGVVTVLQFLPITIFSLVGGVVADRLPRREMIIAVTLVETLQAVALAILSLTNQINLWEIYVLALILGIATAFELPSRQAFVGEVVGREDLQSAVGLNSSVFNSARIIGPGLGGIIIAIWGVGWCFGLNAISYLAVLITLAMMRTDLMTIGVRRATRTALFGQILDGLQYSIRSPVRAFPIVLLAFVGLFGYNFSVTLPLLARYGLHLDSVGFGNLNAAMGLGAVIGALLVTGRITPTPRNVLLAGFGFSFLILPVAFVPWYGVALILLCALGILNVAYSASTNTILQLNSSDEYRGRVLSLYSLLFAGTTPFGGAISGWLAEVWDIQICLAVESVVCLLAVAGAAVYLYQGHRHMGQHPTPAEEYTSPSLP